MIGHSLSKLVLRFSGLARGNRLLVVILRFGWRFAGHGSGGTRVKLMKPCIALVVPECL